MNRQTNLDYLSNHVFFSGLSGETLQFLNECSSTHDIKKEQILFLQGETADTFFVVLSGHISIQIPAIMGPCLEIQVLGQDQVLGWSWLISPYKWSFQAKAVDDSKLLMFDGKVILKRCEQDPKFGYELLKKFAELMSVRLDAARKKMMDEWNPDGFA
jgi:CRP/FNR family transcriptional regulator, cyclic AMP receptor protein